MKSPTIPMHRLADTRQQSVFIKYSIQATVMIIHIPTMNDRDRFPPAQTNIQPFFDHV